MRACAQRGWRQQQFHVPAKKEQRRTVKKLAIALEHAYHLGESLAQKRLGQARGTQEGLRDFLSGITEKAQGILTTFLVTVQDWFGIHGDEEEIEQSFDEMLENMTVLTAQSEIVDAIESGVFDTFLANQVQQVVWVAQPDACRLCQDNAGDGPVNLGEAFSSGDTMPPAHPRCRCHLDTIDGGDVWDET